jgi:alpha-methylacyl-CoA racemase
VLAPLVAPKHPHNRARATFVDIGGVQQPAPAPRFSGTPAALPRPPHTADDGALEQVRRWGVEQARIDELVRTGVLRAGGAQAC